MEALVAKAAQISRRCENRGIVLEAFHLPESFNSIADHEPRKRSHRRDWGLKEAVFCMIADRWIVETGLFASAWDAQLKSFISWTPQSMVLFQNIRSPG